MARLEGLMIRLMAMRGETLAASHVVWEHCITAALSVQCPCKHDLQSSHRGGLSMAVHAQLSGLFNS